jgi:hypothetical protein
MKYLTTALAAAAFLVPASAQASILFTVNGTFSGGGALTGTFITNDARSVLESVNLTSTAFDGATYTNKAEGGASILPNFLQFDQSSPFKELRISFASPLAATGSTTIWFGSYEASGDIKTFRDLSGSITASAVTAGVPEPSTWAMMLVGFAAIGFGLRRKQRQEVRLNFA